MQSAKCIAVGKPLATDGKYKNAKCALESTKFVIFKTTLLIKYFEKVKVKYSRCNITASFYLKM